MWIQDALEGLAKRAAAGEWQQITLASGFTSKGLNACRKVNGLVEVHLLFAVSAANTNYANIFAAALPEGYRPAANAPFAVCANSVAVARGLIDSTGMGKFYNSATTSAWFYCHALFPAE